MLTGEIVMEVVHDIVQKNKTTMLKKIVIPQAYADQLLYRGL